MPVDGQSSVPNAEHSRVPIDGQGVVPTDRQRLLQVPAEGQCSLTTPTDGQHLLSVPTDWQCLFVALAEGHHPWSDGQGSFSVNNDDLDADIFDLEPVSPCGADALRRSSWTEVGAMLGKWLHRSK